MAATKSTGRFANIKCRLSVKRTSAGGRRASAMTSATAGETLRLARSCQYVLTAALPEVSQDLTIEGNGATLERSTAAGTPDFAIITVTGGAFTGNAGGAINFGSIEVRLYRQYAQRHQLY